MNLKNIGLSTSAFGYAMGNTGKGTDRRNPTPWTLEEFVEFTHAHGLGGVEAPLRRFIPDLDLARIAGLKAMLEERDMFFIMDAEGALDVEEITALMPFANELGSPIIRIKSSAILGCTREKLGKPWSEHVAHCTLALKSLAPALREHGLSIAIENHQDLDSTDLAQIIEAVGADVVGVNFDIGNAFATCEDPLTFAEKLGPKIINVHLKEYQIWKSEDGFRLVRCPVGAGAVDFKTVLPLLAKNAPNAKMVIELGALEARNIAWLAPGFFGQMQLRTGAEVVAFFAQLERYVIRRSNDSWQTPWERGSPGTEVKNYEVAELESSLTYLSTL